MNTDAAIVVTGADGFVGRNLVARLGDAGYGNVTSVSRTTDPAEADAAIAGADAIFHLAGANRPARVEEFGEVNTDLAARLAATVRAAGTAPLIVYTSSAKANDDTPYGASKRGGEDALLSLADTGAVVAIQRLPNIFGKWARPNYNSAVATFCHNIARGLDIRVDDPASPLELVYVDDLIDQWLALLAAPPTKSGFVDPPQSYHTTVGAVADTIRGFASDRAAGFVADVGVGLTRALYATFVAALPEDVFAYPLVAHSDPRGSFSEMLKTRDSGQFSYFTAHPGVTRGGHYHHTKTEKFLIVHGEALFRFRHVVTGATHEVRTSGASPMVVETIPGWAHDVTNVGDDMMISLLWANEVFDRARPDTITAKV